MSKCDLPSLKVKLQITEALPLQYHKAPVSCNKLNRLGSEGEGLSPFL